MKPNPLKQKKLFKLIALYFFMAVAVISIVFVIFMFVLGYRIDNTNGQIEQYSFFQFNSSPVGATVAVDGLPVNAQTPNKVSLPAGTHNVVMKKDNYQDWTKSVSVKSATLTWLNYAILVPKKLNVEQISKYDLIYASLASPEGSDILIQTAADIPSFDLVDLTSDATKTTKIVLPAKAYSESTTAGVAHIFQAIKWDDGGRYVLLRHAYNDKSEWIVFDSQDVNMSKNITQLFNLAINDIYFAGTNGNNFYVLSSNDVRKLDLAAGTISKPLVSNVTSFSLYKTNVVAYIGIGDAIKNEQVAGIYREGDENSHVLRKITGKDTPFKISTARYFNEDYVVIAEGNKVDILGGSYPTGGNDTKSLKNIGTFNSAQDIHKLSFSPSGEYVLTQSDAYFASYDIERQIFTESNIEGVGPVSDLKWLDNNYVWSDRDGKLAIREFDGANMHTINAVLYGQDVVMTHNKRYIYSINKLVDGYQLQRVRMILP